MKLKGPNKRWADRVRQMPAISLNTFYLPKWSVTREYAWGSMASLLGQLERIGEGKA